MYCGGNIIHLVIWNMVHGSTEPGIQMVKW